MQHPHDLMGTVPERLDPSVVRRLSVIAPRRALAAIASEWLLIAVTIGVALRVDAWWTSVAACVLIGARQHALMVLAHDASHFRLLPNRALNDWVANLLLAWPTFISVQGFRHFHGDHHRFLNQEGDGNRKLWGTHDARGQRSREWTYPKTPWGLALTLLRRGLLATGAFWMVRGLIGGFMFGAPPLAQVVRPLLWCGVGWVLGVVDGWWAFLLYWVVPYCTWHVVAQYVRLICEHSNVRSDDPRYADTRSTTPGWLGRLLVLPRNIGYHIEHHWYPSVPFYRLPELHACLAAQAGYRAHARHGRSIVASLRQCVRWGA